MIEPEHTITSGIELFAKPKLSDFRISLLEDWKADFADDVLAGELVENPRLANRVAKEVCGSLDQPLHLEGPVDSERHTIAALMHHGSDRVSELAGCIWYRPTVLDWITWNNLSENLPEMDIGLLRVCFRSVPIDLARTCGAPAEIFKDLTQEMLVEAGQACLSAWLLEAPHSISSRLSLFIEPQSDGDSLQGAEIIRALAPCLVEDDT